jgi:hypothetical protein
MNGKLNPFYPATFSTSAEQIIERFSGAPGIDPEDVRRCVDEMRRMQLWKNDEYQVGINKTPQHGFGDAEVWHLSIKRLDKAPVHDWRDLQAIKNMLVGPEYEAIELYPAESRLMDTANQYHLFVFVQMGGIDMPTIPLGFTGRAVSGPDAAAVLGAVQRPL